jgi:hypothetical protein
MVREFEMDIITKKNINITVYIHMVFLYKSYIFF